MILESRSLSIPYFYTIYDYFSSLVPLYYSGLKSFLSTLGFRRNPQGPSHNMTNAVQIVVLSILAMLAVSGCTPSNHTVSDENPPPAAPATPEFSPATANARSSTAPPASTPETPGDPRQPVETSTSEETDRQALLTSAQTFVNEFVAAIKNGDATAAAAKLLSPEAFEKVVAPGYRSILGSSLLAKNKNELTTLIDTLKGNEVASWKWQPGKLVRTTPRSAFTRSLLQMTGGKIELDVEGVYIAVELDQLIHLEGSWTIFQMHNP